ncbi:hypothetical protein OB236_10850 [Paenibacillus sp. WQ 127069]|uniref:Uncharacterized protein n=1 Tax=Paenibacillus baimaensis TaxID=2982185 RepID=A0ABT2UD98_9BACL|nr:hypothetical protein [Paenibacillus sp. WQ 127069]MCU6792618.1 hypothetical protein [Paenibacillus sp. WQ 127069]
MANYILNLSVVNDEVSDTANVEIIIPDSDNDTREKISFAVTRDDNQEYYCFT